MRVKNIDELKSKLRPLLEQYLNDCGIETGGVHFLCPNKNHADSEPSANFWPDEESFNCHGCEAAGDIFRAAHYIESKPIRGREFITENVLYLAKKYNISYDIVEESEEEKKKKRISSVLELIVAYANTCLIQTKNKQAMLYLEKRGWLNIINDVKIGYTDSESLYRFLCKKNIKDDILEEAGITVIKKNGRVILPIIENRIIIPFNNYYGKVTALIGRSLNEAIQPKYMFSKNTDIHVKMDKLYNLDIAKNFDKVYIVESNASVLTLLANGIKNVVALSGKNMSEKQYSLLVQNEIKEIILCLDNDDTGLKSTEEILYDFRDKVDLRIYIKELPRINGLENKQLKDPDDYINEYGIKKFENYAKVDAFYWILDKFKDNLENKKYKDIIFSRIISETDFLVKDRYMTKLAEKTPFKQKVIKNELEAYSSKKELLSSVKDVIDAKESLLNDIDEFERKVWSRTGRILGLKSGWDRMDRILDGIQDGMILVSGRNNIGKSAFMMNLTHNLLLYNDNCSILYFTLDDPKLKTLSRFIALKSKIPINWVKNAKYCIKYNDDLSEKEKNKLLQSRDLAINFIKQYSGRLTFNTNCRLDDMLKAIKIHKKIAASENRKLVVFIDKINQVKSGSYADTRMKLENVSAEIKNISNEEEITIICASEITKNSIMGRPTEADIKETQKLEDDCDACILMYEDFKINPDSMFVFIDNNKKYPLVEFMFPKNKMNDLSGYDVKMFLKFYDDYAYMEECDSEEFKKYNSMSHNGV